jgi:hypothetical protein
VVLTIVIMKRYVSCSVKSYNPVEAGLISEKYIASIFMVENKRTTGRKLLLASCLFLAWLIFDLQNGGGTLLRNMGGLLSGYMESSLIRLDNLLSRKSKKLQFTKFQSF